MIKEAVLKKSGLIRGGKEYSEVGVEAPRFTPVKEHISIPSKSTHH